MTHSSPPPSSATRIGAACLLAVLLVAAWSLASGSGGWDLALVRELRLPRVLAAAGVGALLALSGLAMQVVLRNPLADPYVLGTSGGASVGVLLALMAGLSLWTGAAAGALASGFLLLVLARRALAGGDDASARLILVGAMLAALSGAMALMLLTLTSDAQLRAAVFWLVGDLSGANDHGICIGLALMLAGLLAWRARSVDRLMLGSEAAELLGEPVRLLRLALVAGGSLAAGAAVAAAGAIGFVGLVVPHGLRLAGITRTRDQAWMAPLAGSALLMAADTMARTLASPLELRVGALMALLGAPLFIVFLIREGR